MTDLPQETSVIAEARAKSRLAVAWDSDVAYSFRRSPVAVISAAVNGGAMPSG